MTRSRSSQPGDIPNELMAEYYEQRTSAGIIITEGTQVSLQGKGYAGTPGIYTPEQIEGWKKVTERVHQKGGKIFLQLWHVGRISHAKINGLTPIGPSSLKADNSFIYDEKLEFFPAEPPRKMTHLDILQSVEEFAQGAKNAMKAGFDGVEIHGANGYLIDQFLRSNSNKRTDQFGGSVENRIRFLMKVVQAVSDAVGKEKTGVRLSPFVKSPGLDDPEIFVTILAAVVKLNEIGVTYLHLAEPDWDHAPEIPLSFRLALREKFDQTIISTGNMTIEQAEDLLGQNLADIIGFGRKFLSNPDFPEKVRLNKGFNEVDMSTLVTGGCKGYTDYPFMEL